ncbi:MAG: GNAT family N-acetyltransferase [Pseudomonadota bacterium]|nr:GNAT family N-acetyltransferase [Pseudomonadota bacterium]
MAQTIDGSDHVTVTRGDFTISTDATLIDEDFVTGFLTTSAYWSRGVAPDLILSALKNSELLGLYEKSGRQIGFARIVTDYALFAYLRDVFVDQAYRGRGLGLWMTETALAHPRLQTVRNWMLATEDAHGIYMKAGFEPLKHPEWYMQRPGKGLAGT